MAEEIKEANSMSEEQAADLAALHAAAGTGAGEPEAAGGAVAQASLSDEIAGLVHVVVKVLTPALPCLGKIYTDETIGAASGAVAAVCEKHGWLSGGLLGEYGEEIGAAVVLVPLAIATYQGVKGDMEAAKLEQEKRTMRQRADFAQHLVVTRGLDGQPEQVGAGVKAGTVSAAEQPPAAGVTFGQVRPA